MTLSEPVLELLLALIGGGMAGALVTHFTERKMRAYELKLQKYLELGAALGSIPVTRTLDNDVMQILNGALVFSSDEVATEVLKLILLISERQSSVATHETGSRDITAEECKPLLLAIRNDLDLRSCSLRRLPFRFFGR